MRTFPSLPLLASSLSFPTEPDSGPAQPGLAWPRLASPGRAPKASERRSADDAC